MNTIIDRVIRPFVLSSFFLISLCVVVYGAEGDAAGVQSVHAKVFQGKVYCYSIYPVQSTFIGEAIEKKAKVGQLVKQGEVLLKIELTEEDRYSLAKRVDKELFLLRAQHDVTTLNRELAQLKKKLKDAEELVGSGMAPERSVKDIESEIVFAQNRIQLVNKELAALKRELKNETRMVGQLLGSKASGKIPAYAFVRAPVDGYIVWEKPNINVGALVAGKVFDIGVMDPMIVRTQVYEADTVHINPGDKAEVILEFGPDRIMEATVKSIAWLPVDKKIEAPSYYMVELEIPNPDLTLKEGYKVRVMFPNSGQDSAQ